MAEVEAFRYLGPRASIRVQGVGFVLGGAPQIRLACCSEPNLKVWSAA